MIDRKTKLRFRRNVRKGRRQVEDLSIQAEEHLERLFIRRLHRLINVRRFVLTWLTLIVFLVGASVFQLRALSGHYLKSAPDEGGVYTEGVIGSFTNANPLYAIGGVNGEVSRLLFSSLLEYDKNGSLVGDLATDWRVDETGKIYTVTIREDVLWHDQTPLTVDDVVFTYQTLQNPDAKSPLFISWRDVRIEASDNKVIFTLPNVFAAFPHSLTNGIVPKHILENVVADQLRSDRFNTVSPIGSGPFMWDLVEVTGETPEERQEHIALTRNPNYYKGSPKLQRFIIKTFRSEEFMTKRFADRELTAMGGLSSISDSLERGSFQEMNLPLTGAVMVFFRTTEGVLQDKAVRQALVHGVNVGHVVRSLSTPVIRVDSPLLRGQLGYNTELTQLDYNVKKAQKLLDEAGWKANGDGVRQKGDELLRFSLKAPNDSEFTIITRELQNFWSQIGVQVDVDQPGDNELQSIVALHQYEAVLYSVSIGNDPDVFAFWHSSQADVRAENRLNFSEYQSNQADQALEGGRTRIDPKLRAVKYEPFLRAWREDAPALALYQPNYLYIARDHIEGFNRSVLHSSKDRFNNVENWSIRTKKVYKN